VKGVSDRPGAEWSGSLCAFDIMDRGPRVHHDEPAQRHLGARRSGHSSDPVLDLVPDTLEMGAIRPGAVEGEKNTEGPDSREIGPADAVHRRPVRGGGMRARSSRIRRHQGEQGRRQPGRERHPAPDGVGAVVYYLKRIGKNSKAVSNAIRITPINNQTVNGEIQSK
jgi:hypothetical protein